MIQFKKGRKWEINHWIAQRVSAIALIPISILLLAMLVQGNIQFNYPTGSEVISILALITKYNGIWGYVFLAFAIVTLVHLVSGVQNIIKDYVHNAKTEMLTKIFLTCVQIVLFKYSVLFIITE